MVDPLGEVLLGRLAVGRDGDAESTERNILVTSASASLRWGTHPLALPSLAGRVA